MNEQLETIKANLPRGYEKTIAKKVGCTVQTVGNVLNGRYAKKSIYRMKVLAAASTLAKNNLKAMREIMETTDNLSKAQM